MARALNGNLLQVSKVNGFRDKYNFKLLTLTCPGKEYREEYTTWDAYQEMMKAFQDLVKAMRQTLGKDFLFFRVVENQQDGFPHFHVILSGKAIAPRWVLRYIENLWRARYGEGFVKLNKVRSPERAVAYVLKYLFKNPADFGEGNHFRLHSASQNTLDPVWKSDRIWHGVIVQWGSSSLDAVAYRLDVEARVEEGQEYWEYKPPLQGCPF